MKRDAIFDIDRYLDATLYREQMHGYQNTALDFLKKNPFSGLFIDMGLGKTVIGSTLIRDIIDSTFTGELEPLADGEKILIIGPLRVATTTWPDEFKNWYHLAGYNLSVVHVADDDPELKSVERGTRAAGRANNLAGTALDKFVREQVARRRESLRQERAMAPATIHCISRDWIEWLVEFYGPRWPYRVVLIDESSGFKDHNSGRFKALQEVRGQSKHFPPHKWPIRRLHIMSATPAAESYEGLFSQIWLLDCGKRLGKTISYFREEYFTYDKYKRKWKLRPSGEKAILAKITDICLVMKEQDYLPREAPLFVERTVQMDQKQMQLYLTMEKDMVVQLDDGTEVTADSAAALSAKLLQMASGVLYDTTIEPGQDEDDDHVKVLKIHRIHDHKIDMLREIVEEAQGKQILVGYHHRSSKDRILKAFKDAVPMDRDGKCVKKWNDGKIPMLVMHPASGGHGLNLQKGGHIIVFFDIPWSLELYLQFIGRLARQGQKHRVTVFLLVCKGTLDHTVVQALQAKENAQDLLFKILKKMRKKLGKLLREKKNALKDGWDEVVEILTDYVDDEPAAAKPKYGLDAFDDLEIEEEECEF